MKKPHPVPPWQPRVRVRFSTGEIYEFGSKSLAARWAGRPTLSHLVHEKQQDDIQARANDWDNDESMTVSPYRPGYRFFTEMGDELAPEDLLQVLRTESRWYPRSYPNPRMRGSGRWRAPYLWFRRPRTFAEHRWVSGFAADARYAGRYCRPNGRYGKGMAVPAGESDESVDWRRVKIRQRRNNRNLVDAWDDLPRSSRARHSSWKRQRRHQWKG